MTPTVGALIEFILRNKGPKCFSYCNEAQIWAYVKDALDEGTLFYSTDRHGHITGMIIAEKRNNNTTLFIIENIAMSLSNLKEFAKRASVVFKGMKIESYRHGRHVKYNTDKLYKKLI